MQDIFRHFAMGVSKMAGSAKTFFLACLLIIVWLATGPIFNFSDTWQLFVNTLTTIITFLMVFLIQNTQNRDTKAVHLKLDELLRSIKNARNRFIEIEQLGDAELEALHQEFEAKHIKAEAELAKRRARRSPQK